jgi:hypothetical protein
MLANQTAEKLRRSHGSRRPAADPGAVTALENQVEDAHDDEQADQEDDPDDPAQDAQHDFPPGDADPRG